MDKKVIVVLVAVAVIGAAAYAVLTRIEPEIRTETEEHPFPALQVEPPQDPKERREWQSPIKKEVDRIELTRNGKTIVLERTKKGEGAHDVGEWKMVKPVDYKANTGKIRQLINRIERLEFWEVYTKRKEDFKDLKVDGESGVRAKIMAGKRVLADMIIGKTIQTKIADRNQTYTAVRKHSSNTVWKVVGSLTNVFDQPADKWRDSEILSEKQDRIAGLVIKDSDGSLLAAKRNPDETDRQKKRNNWELVASTPTLDKLDQNDFSRLSTSVARLRAKDFADDKKPEDVGLDKPERKIFAIFKKETAKKPEKPGETTGAEKTDTEKTKEDEKKVREKPDSGDASEETGASGAEVEGKTGPTGIPAIDSMASNPDYVVHEIKLGKEDKENKTRYLKLAQNSQIFAIAHTSARNLEKKITEYRDKTVLELDPSQIVKLEVQHPKGKTVLAKVPSKPKEEDKKGDKKEDKKEKKADSEKVMVWEAQEPKDLELDKAAVDRLMKTLEGRFRARQFSETTDPEKTGLKKPTGRVIFTLKDNRKTVELLIGDEQEKRQYYVQVKGKPEVYIIGSYPLTQVYKEPDKWKKRARGSMPPGMGRGGMRMPPQGMRRRNMRR